MREIQEPFLNRIQPGTNPIFIVSPNRSDGDSLANLLSRSLQSHNENYKTTKADSKSYFAAPPEYLFSQRIEERKIPEYRQVLKLMVDEGFDNKKLWGLSIDYRLFLELEIGSLFPTASFIFLYGKDVRSTENENLTKIYTEKILQFIESHRARCQLIYINNLTYNPTLILNSLLLADGTSITIRDEVTTAYKEPASVSPTDTLPQDLRSRLNNLNILTETKTWYNGDELCIILNTDSSLADAGALIIEKIKYLRNSFLKSPGFIFISHSDAGIKLVTDVINEYFPNDRSFTFVRSTGSLGQAINDTIRDSQFEYFIIDSLTQSYSIVSLLSPFKDPENSFAVITHTTFKNKTGNSPADRRLDVVDIVTLGQIPHDIAFRRAAWQTANGFDTCIEDSIVIWDFCINLAEISPGSIAQIEAQRASGDTVEISLSSVDDYIKAVNKHGQLFEKNLDEIVRKFAETQYLPLGEIAQLKNNVSAIQSLLSHSKDEIKSLNQLTAELQHKINALESKWYYRLARKINRLRKIFFGKKAPGSSSALNVIKFLVFSFTKPGARIVRKIAKNALRKLYLAAEERPVQIVFLDTPQQAGVPNNYNDWIKRKLDSKVLKQDYDEHIAALKYQPLISIIVPVYNPPLHFLKHAIESVMNQTYANWELCLADDLSPDPQVQKLLAAYSLKDSRIKTIFRTENGHISAASNSALSLATGDYILLMDHDDLLTANCCFEIVKYINENPTRSDIIYSDEDKVDEHNNHSVPHFKPDWAPDNLLSRNYFGHVVCLKKEIMNTLGGFRLGFEGSQDYDLILRATELSTNIGHIPKVLYHWRIHAKSAAQSEEVKPYAYIAAKKALEEALVRRNTPGEVHFLSGLRGYRIEYKVTKPGRVSVIIPTKDKVKLLKNTVDSLLKRTDYPDYEIIVINNNSSSSEFFNFIKEYSSQHKNHFRCIDANFPFNFSRLMNIGVAECTGEYILLLNNDVEVIDSQWMTTMVSHAQYHQTGAVGVKLLYPDDNIQHAGVIVGLGGVAGHAFVNYYKDDAGYFNYIQSTDNYSAVTAACLMVRREVYEEVGGFDEQFEVEYNDVDFCLKVLDHGYYNVYLADVELYHYESATRGHPHQTKESWERHIREIDLFKAKWSKYTKRDPFYNPNLRLDVHDFQIDYNV